MYTVVIADDEVIECKSLNILLKNEFKDLQIVQTVANGIELIQAVEKHKPDIALVDVEMPGMNGLEAIELLMSKETETKFVILTAYDEFMFVQKALSLKVSEYLLKPLKKDIIVQKIQELCRYIDESRHNKKQEDEKKTIFSKIDSVLEKEVMFSILMGEPAGDDFKLLCNLKGLEFKSAVFITLKIDEQKNKINTIDKVFWKEQIENELKKSCNYLLSCNNGNAHIIVIIPEHIEDGELFLWIENLTSVLFDKLKKTTEYNYRLGISSVSNDFNKMYQLYNECLMALKILPDQEMVFYSQIASTVNEAFENNFNKPTELNHKTFNINVAKAIDYVENHYFEDISLELIADEILISPFYLSRIFKQEKGINFTEYITKIRIEKAVLLAKTTELTVREIGERVGYRNQTYFCRVFKKTTGMTISQIKIRSKKNV